MNKSLKLFCTVYRKTTCHFNFRGNGAKIGQKIEKLNCLVSHGLGFQTIEKSVSTV